MLLKTVRITKFKCVNDSTPFSFDSHVTCLVGKNEAGKTAILEALYKLKPVRDGEGEFDVTKEYFRPEVLEYKARHEKTPDTAVEAVWELEPDDVRAVEELIGPEAASRVGPITIRKKFDNKIYVTCDFDEASVVGTLLAASAVGDQNTYTGTATVKDLLSRLAAVPETQAKLTEQLKRRFGDKSPRQALNDLLYARIPHFAFFSQYLRLPGQLAVNQFKARFGANQLSDEDRVFTSLLEMIGMSVDGFAAVASYEDLTARLEAASGRLTRELRNYWPDGKHLSMDFKFDDALPGDPPPFNAASNPGKIFRARIKNERYDVSTAFDQRSSGFIWFFSFLVWFTQLEKNYKTDLVILMDGPGMSVHGTSQKELLRFIEQRLAPKYQVLYTTHSPFMLDPSNLHRARPVEDVYREPGPDEDVTTDPARGTKVFEDWWTADKLTLFPLRGCLAYDITQTLFVGAHNLLVEGPADLMYIDWFKRKLASLRRPTLDARWTVTPCGSVSKIGAFLNLFSGNHLHCAVLTDWADGSKKEVRSLGETAVLTSAQVFTADQYAGRPQADLEDLLGNEFYSDLINRTYDLKPPDQLSIPSASTARVVKVAEDHMRLKASAPEFTHPGPADYLLRQGIDATYPGLDGALDRFQKLFEAFNKALADYLRDRDARGRS